MPVWVGLAAAAAVGAPLRFMVDTFVQRRTLGAFPWGTLVVNVAGSLLLGALVGLSLYRDLGDTAMLVAGTGFCGAFTTFSTFSYETVRLVEQGDLAAAARNVFANLAACVGAAALGVALIALVSA